MISRLPRWAWVGAAALAFTAGIINAVGFLGFQHQGVTHLTGSTTLLGIALANGNSVEAWHLFGIATAFLSGCVISGALVRDSALMLGRRYGVALAAESALLFAAAPLLAHSQLLGAYLASCACGLQNGMVSTYSGAVLRTTHVSGAFTDLGILIGQRLRGFPADQRRMRLCVSLIAGFLLGAWVGAATFATFEYATLYFPAASIGIIGITYAIYRHRRVHCSTN